MKVNLRNDAIPALGGAVLLAGLYLTSLYSYILFHSLIEVITVAVAWAVFILTWNSRRLADNPYILFVGIAYLFVGIVDLLHALAYKGMGVFPGNDANLATQLWIAGRYLQSISLLIAPLFLRRKLNTRWTYAAFSLVVALLLASIFVWRNFPDCYVEGHGLTAFKIVSEYIVIGILLAAVLVLERYRNAFDPKVKRNLTAALGLTMLAELAFTLYISVYDLSNLSGHFIRLVALYFLYRAIIVNGLINPFDELFRNLKRTEESLRASESSVRHKLDNILLPGGRVADLELSDIMDTGAIQSLMDDFYPLTHVPMSVIDSAGRVLVGVGWQDICSNFHRKHPAACAHCLESDLHLSAGVRAGEFRLYKCKNNMWDIATPIYVGDQHVGNVFSGQFFFEDESVDRQLFIGQAHQYGFDEKAYLAALDCVPRLSRERVQTGMTFLTKLADLISRLGYSNLKLARTVHDRDALMQSVQDNREALRKLNGELEQRNTELEIANQELESFSYSVSHDLRAPLAVIDGFTQLLLQDHADELPPEAMNYLGLIHQSATGMTQLISDLLVFSRTARQPVLKQVVRMAELVREVLAGLEASRNGRTIEVRVGDLPDAAADPILVKQVLTNLLANAFKFTRTRVVACVEVGYGSCDDEPAYFVKDNGVGFDMAQAERLFGVFQRLHREDEYEGTGVGLAIVERIVRRHGGRVWAQAAPDEGATFWFTLPPVEDVPLVLH